MDARGVSPWWVGVAVVAAGLGLGGCGGSTEVPADAAAGDAPPADGGDAGDAGEGGTCATECGMGRECCGGSCVNTANDPRHCGACGVVCAADTYCNGMGQCTAPPCTAGCGAGTSCCGSACCGAGELCCDPQGPLGTDPVCTAPDARGTCPTGCAPLCVCASPDTPIATPTGERPIAALREGDLVYSVQGGRVVVVPIAQTRRVPVLAHRVMRLTLESGVVLELSPRHPTADGRLFSELVAGASLDGVRIAAASVVPYTHAATHDILPASDTGAYFAGGVLVGSTLAPPGAPLVSATHPACEAP